MKTKDQSRRTKARMPHCMAWFVFAISIAMARLAGGAEPAAIRWSAKDINGAEVTVPVADRPSVVAFVRPDQEQSRESLAQIRSSVPDAKSVQVIVVVSGPLAGDQAKALVGEAARGWPVVADPDFAASGKMNIHVWPTTIVIKADGTQAAHLAGLSQTFAADLSTYLEFAAGKLDDAHLNQKLATHDIVTDTPAQAASRHLQVAQRLLERGHTDEARNELAEGLKHNPDDPILQLMLARVYVMLNQPREAIDLLDKLAPDAAPAWQANLLRGRALIGLQNWQDAKTVLPGALKLNPDPSEAHYLLGLCYQHDQDWPNAAEQFRLAFESSSTGQKLVPAPEAR